LHFDIELAFVLEGAGQVITQVAVDLKVVTEYHKNVPDIYEKIKEVIRKEVAAMTELDVVEVNVTVTDIKTKEQQKDD
ncbi:Asp23/Gls24 family envelope stress response protein, partial [Lactococcus lactis]